MGITTVNLYVRKRVNGKELIVKPVSSEKNLADLFTKSLGSVKHWDLLQGIGMVQK